MEPQGPEQAQMQEDAGDEGDIYHTGELGDNLLSLETSTYLQKSWNDVVAKVMRENDCFIGIAQVPTRDVDLAIEEARRATRDLGFRGIQIHGSWGSKNIESFEWWPFFEEIER